jgi:cysteine desulfurase
MRRVYLDHNATTPVDPAVAAVMIDVLERVPGNSSSLHWFGQQARAIVEESREAVAQLIGAQPSEIVFTASGTEADNMALRGVAATARDSRRRLVHSTIEHHAVIRCAQALAQEGQPVATARVGSEGSLDLDELTGRLDGSTALVALMLANNETGVLQPVREAARIAHERGALVLCDAVQAAGKVAVDVTALGVDLLALSAHKLYGPKGVGALYVRRGTRLEPLVRGGSQERNRRAGTENVAGIAGFGAAARLARERLAEDVPRIARLRDRLEEGLLAIPGAERNGTGERVPNTSNVSFTGVKAESLVLALDLAGVAVATGAACASGAVEPSHVLRAMGLPPARVEGSLRLSLGRGNVEDDVTLAVGVLAEAVERQRALKKRA